MCRYEYYEEKHTFFFLLFIPLIIAFYTVIASIRKYVYLSLH